MNIKYTPQLEKAIRFACALHRKQIRRDSMQTPYTSHLFSTMIILSQYTKNQHYLIASLLHDTVEDTSYSIKQLEKDFGEKVKNIVLEVTDAPKKQRRKYTWLERKELYLQNLSHASKGGLMVSCADKIHNLQSLINEYEIIGNKLWKSFKHYPKENRVQYFEDVYSVISQRLDNPITKHLKSNIRKAKKLFH